MKKILIPLFALCALFMMMLSSCKSANVAFDQVNTLMDGKWYFYSYGNNKVAGFPEEEWPYVELNTNSGSLTGNAGCNQITGQFTFNNTGSIQFERLASTRMMCPNMGLEDALGQTLPNVKRYDINKVTGMMSLIGAKNDTLFKLARICPVTILQYKQSY